MLFHQVYEYGVTLIPHISMLIIMCHVKYTKELHNIQ
jgi:hypothetical protein